MPGTRPQLLYALTRAARPVTVVEFGTSYGISALHLAAAVTDNGTGHVYTTELSRKKAAAARANLDEAGAGGGGAILEGGAPTCPVPSGSSCSTSGRNCACSSPSSRATTAPSRTWRYGDQLLDRVLISS